ncbi:acetyltransferase [Scytonema sp. PRP1]|uniref:acetyltransferase n=1 Tax=Scytonema sp. PRP1 TaxID=3120513 RepID=UPI002FD02CC2
MLLQLKDSGELVKIVDVQELINPNQDVVHAQEQEGQEEQQADSYKKENLVFPSGESLPRCWLDADYRNGKVS